MKKSFPKFRLTIFVLAMFVLASGFVLPAQAENAIDVEYPVGTNINGDNIFHADNVYPGWSESKTIRVGNKSTTDDVNLYFNFNVKGDKTLAEKLKLYVVRVSDNSYRVGGSGDHWDLKAADEKNLYVDKLSTEQGKQYKIKIKFDENAGNEYQGLETKFDIDFTIESEVATGGATASTESAILASQGRSGFTGNEEAPVEPGVRGEETQVPGVFGESTACVSWPLWIWILVLVIYGGAFNYRNFQNLKQQRRKRWFFQALLSIGAVAFWFYFDTCRVYNWFPIVALLGGAVSFGYYIYKFGRKDYIG